MMTNLDPIDNMFLGPVYRTAKPEVRAEIDALLGFETGHRDSNKIVVAYCRAAEDVREKIDALLGLDRDGDNRSTVRRD